MKRFLIAGFATALLMASGFEIASPLVAKAASQHKEVAVPIASGSEDRFEVMTREAQELLIQNGLLLDHPELNAYLTRIGKSLLSEEEQQKFDFNVMILEHPGTNAFAFGDGTIGIHTGLLIQIENEAQLATVFAHEIIHFIHGHPYDKYDKTKDNTAFWMTLSIGTGGIAALPALLALPAGVSGYSRSLEKQADIEGWDRLIAAGYDGREAPKVFSLFKENLEEDGKKESFFFSSHPKLDNRIENFQELLDETEVDWSQQKLNTDEYLEQVAFLVEDTIILNLESGYSTRARRLIDHEAKMRGESAMTAYLRAESARRNEDSTTEEVHALFKSATAYPNAHADAWKGHGIAAMKLKIYGEAETAFNHYLDLKPNAEDRAHIEYYLKQCTKNQP